MRRAWLGLLLIIPLAGAVPLPPDNVQYEVVEADDDSMTVWLNWSVADVALQSPIAKHRIYVVVEGTPNVELPPLEVEMPVTEKTLELDATSAAIVITAVDIDGVESAPGNPIVIGEGWPRCTWFGWGIQPPGATVHHTCLIP